MNCHYIYGSTCNIGSGKILLTQTTLSKSVKTFSPGCESSLHPYSTCIGNDDDVAGIDYRRNLCMIQAGQIEAVAGKRHNFLDVCDL